MLFHAALLRSKPAADAKLVTAPESIRLVFSEEVVPSLSQIVLIGPLNDSTKLRVSNDPHDVRTLVGVAPPLPGPRSAGRYTVDWSVVSADGHPVSGTFSFSVAAPVMKGPTTQIPADSTALRSAANQDQQKAEELPVLASLLRGFGLGALMAAIGILFFALTGVASDAVMPQRLIGRLTFLGAVLLLFHFAAWLEHIAPASMSGQHFVALTVQSKLGQIELARTGLALLMLLSISVFHNSKLGFAFGVACLLVSGAVGHSAAIDPLWAIPGKSVHLVAGALWLGGLLWLLIMPRADQAIRQSEALRVSSYALFAVIAVLVTGLLQTVLFLDSLRDILTTTYGKLVIAKIIGVLLLIGYGAYNRYSLIPRFSSGGDTKLRTSMRQEIFIISLLIVIGGFLAYISPNPVRTSDVSITRGAQ